MDRTKIGVDIGICLGNNQDNLQLHRFTRRENTAKSFFLGGLLFWLILYTISSTSWANKNNTNDKWKLVELASGGGVLLVKLAMDYSVVQHPYQAAFIIIL